MPALPTPRAALRAPLSFLALVGLAACDLTTEADQDTFFVSFATDPAATTESPDDITVTGDGHTLVISAVDFVVDDAGLARNASQTGCAAASAGECTTVTATPALVSLPIGGDEEPIVTPFTIRAQEQYYRSLEFSFHTPSSGDPDDEQFLDEHPTFEGVGIRVTGTWDGAAFELERPMDADVLIEFDELFPGDEQWNLTVATDVAEWFLTAGGAPFDPSTAAVGGVNAERFVGNVLASFRAFRDFNRNGQNDSGT